MICPKCGALLPKGAKFCTECGVQLTQPAPVQQPAQPAGSQPQAPAQPFRPTIPDIPAAPVQQPAQPFRPAIPSAPAMPVQQPVPPTVPPAQAPAASQAPVFQQQSAAASGKKSSYTALIIVLSVVGALLIAAAIFLLPRLFKTGWSAGLGETPAETAAPSVTEAPGESDPAEILPAPAEPGHSGARFPAALPAVLPDGMRPVQLGGISIAVPADYDTDVEYDDEIQLYHPDYPDVIAQIMLACEEGAMPGDEQEGLEELRENMGDIVEEWEFEEEEYTVHYLRGIASDEDMGLFLTSHCYVFVQEGALYAVAVLTDGQDPRIDDVLNSIAFDPTVEIAFSGGETASLEDWDDPPADGYDAKEDPTLEDFSWAINAEPQSPTRFITDPEELDGRWKCCIEYGDLMAYELCNAEFSADGGMVQMELRYYSFQYNGEEPIDETGDEPVQFFGTFKAGTLHLTGVGTIDCGSIYTWRGRQYFAGLITTLDGNEYPIWMVRP